MGFILFGVAIGSFESIQAGLIYMIIYIMSICSFSILLSLNLTKDFIIEVKELSRKNPVLGGFFLDNSFTSIIKSLVKFKDNNIDVNFFINCRYSSFSRILK